MTRLNEIKERAKKATAGPWKVKHYLPCSPIDNKTNSWFSDVVQNGEEVCKFLDFRDNRAHDDPGEAPTADFIAHARSDIPWLIAEVERLTAVEHLCENPQPLQRFVEKQANDPALWFEAMTAPEQFLQTALRELHEIIDKEK